MYVSLVAGAARVLPPSNFDGSPVLVVSGRLPMMPPSASSPHNPMTKIKSNKCLWGAVQTVQTICDYVFRKNNLFTYVSVVCGIAWLLLAVLCVGTVQLCDMYVCISTCRNNFP